MQVDAFEATRTNTANARPDGYQTIRTVAIFIRVYLQHKGREMHTHQRTAVVAVLARVFTRTVAIIPTVISIRRHNRHCTIFAGVWRNRTSFLKVLQNILPYSVQKFICRYPRSRRRSFELETVIRVQETCWIVSAWWKLLLMPL